MLWQPAACSTKQSPAAVEGRDEQCGSYYESLCVFDPACVLKECFSEIGAGSMTVKSMLYMRWCVCACIRAEVYL